MLGIVHVICFVYTVLGAHKVVVTDTWILKICPHRVHVLRQYESAVKYVRMFCLQVQLVCVCYLVFCS